MIQGRKNELFTIRATSDPRINFENYLRMDGGGTNYDCAIFHDIATGEAVNTRCSYNRNAGSEKYALRTAYNVPMILGDVLSFSGNRYLVTRDVAKQIDCYVTAPTKCNASLDILRDIPAKTDENGYLIEAATTQTIVAQQPCVITDNIGNLAAYGAGTWTAENPVLLFQLNKTTAQIKEDDFFFRGGDKYRVLAVGRENTSLDGQTGVLTVTARKEAGCSTQE